MNHDNDDLHEELTTYAILGALQADADGKTPCDYDRNQLRERSTPPNVLRFMRGCILNRREILPNLEDFASAVALANGGKLRTKRARAQRVAVMLSNVIESQMPTLGETYRRAVAAVIMANANTETVNALNLEMIAKAIGTEGHQ